MLSPASQRVNNVWDLAIPFSQLSLHLLSCLMGTDERGREVWPSLTSRRTNQLLFRFCALCFPARTSLELERTQSSILHTRQLICNYVECASPIRIILSTFTHSKASPTVISMPRILGLTTIQVTMAPAGKEA